MWKYYIILRNAQNFRGKFKSTLKSLFNLTNTYSIMNSSSCSEYSTVYTVLILVFKYSRRKKGGSDGWQSTAHQLEYSRFWFWAVHSGGTCIQRWGQQQRMTLLSSQRNARKKYRTVLYCSLYFRLRPASAHLPKLISLMSMA